MAGWWSRLFGRRGAPAPPSPALPAAVEQPPAPAVEPPSAPAVEPPAEPTAEPAREVTPEPDDGREISAARLDAALERLREAHPPEPEN